MARSNPAPCHFCIGENMASCNNDYASKGLANGVGIPALVLGSLGFLQSGGLGGLGGILGGGRGGMAAAGAEVQYVSQLQAENASLKAEQRGDEKNTALYAQTLRDNRALREEMFSFLKPLSDEAANNRVEVAVLKAEAAKDKEITRLEIDNRTCELHNKIAEVASATNLGLSRLNGEVDCLKHTVCQITQTIVPAAAICPQPMNRFNSWEAPTTPVGVELSGSVNTRTSGSVCKG